MGILKAIADLLSGENNEPSAPTPEPTEVFRFKQDNRDGGFRQDKFTIIDQETGGHEHTWSKTTGDGQHKEGWVGSEAERKRNNK